MVGLTADQIRDSRLGSAVDPKADALIRFAQQESITHVVFGQSARSRFDILFRGSVLNRFLSEVRDVTVQVVPMQKPVARRG